MGRSTKVEKNFRVDTVYKLLSEGNSRGQILQFAANQWNVSDRQVDTYIAEARDKLLADCELERPAWVAEALQRLRTLRAGCLQEQAEPGGDQCSAGTGEADRA